MAENMMCSAHKTTTQAFRDGWDRVFCKCRIETEQDRRIVDALHCVQCQCEKNELEQDSGSPKFTTDDVRRLANYMHQNLAVNTYDGENYVWICAKESILDERGTENGRTESNA